MPSNFERVRNDVPFHLRSLCRHSSHLCRYVAGRLLAPELPAAAVERPLLYRSDAEQHRSRARQGIFAGCRSILDAALHRADRDVHSSLRINMGCGMMTSNLSAVLSGAVAMASFATTLFFLKFWRQTSDSFFLLFALAFAIDTLSR